MSCPYADWDGSYVLGSLSAAERLEFERHLDTCDACSRSVRDLAGLPGLLSRVDPTVVEGRTVAPPLPPTLLPALLRGVRRGRRRRLTLAVSGMAAAAVLAAGLTAVVTHDDQPARPVASAPARTMHPVAGAPVRATVALNGVPWGTKIDLTCTYGPRTGGYDLPTRATYALYVRTATGTEQVGTWDAVRGATMHFSAGTATTPGDIQDVEVRTLSGRTVLDLAG
ncbi:MAG: putative rane protein [Nocardioidaceae bacterium]|nr:putative rane protein [Nocardioidaceae bacterium]